MKSLIAPLLLCGILCLAACSSGSAKLQGTDATALDSVQPVELPQNMLAEIPALAELPTIERGFSEVPADFIRKGAEIATPGSRENAITLGDSLIMGPDWDPAATPPKLELSWGIYGFHLPGFARQGVVDLQWGNSPASADAYVGLTDYGSDRWIWRRASELDKFEFGSLDGYFSGLDTIYCCVLLTGSGSFELNSLRLGGNFAPTASFTVNQDTGQYMFTTGFDGSASSDVDGSIAEYHWSFEDPVYFTPGDLGPTPNHYYDHVGSFTCTLRVVDNEGGTGEATATITVTGEPGNLSPTADIFAFPTGGVLPQAINFDASGSMDQDQGILSYRWDLDDDGYHEVQTNLPFAYREFITAGTFTVSLMVIDFFGASGTATTQVTIDPVTGENPPSAELGIDYYCLQTGSMRNLDTSGLLDPDNDIIKYEWDFEGDGSFDYDLGLFPGGEITYTLPGMFTPTVRITDSGGRQATASLAVLASNGVDPQETEPNDAVAEADSLGGLLNYAMHIRDWVGELGGSDTIDWYVIDCDRETDASFWVDFNSLVVDLGIALYDDGDFLAPLIDADLGGDREYIHFHLPAAGTYYLKVFVPQGAVETGPGSYKLTCLENHPPNAVLSGAPDNGAAPLLVSLDASLSSDDEDGLSVSFDYDLNGDGFFEATFENSTINTTLITPGVYALAVSVTDSLGETDVAYKVITVF
ncbi:MAG: PKD domain-containing protein [bacterium]